MNDRPVRLGLIGFGYAGRTFHAPLVAASDGVVLAAVASSQGEAVRAALGDVAVFADPDELIASDAVDAVVVATPNDTHAPLAEAVLAAGKHVVVDKPFALSLAEARRVVAAAEAAGRVLSVFHNRRWDGDFLSVRAAIARGSIGDVVAFESRFDRFRPEVRDRWRERAGAGAGIWYDLGPHLVDQALLLFGLPDAIDADLAALRPGAQADDYAQAVLHYPARRATLHATMLTAGGSARFTVHGTRGSLAKAGADRQEAQLLEGVTPGAPGWGADADPLIVWHGAGDARQVAAIAGDQREFYRGFAAAVHGDASNPVPPIEALAVMAVIEGGLEASARGCRVALALTDAERAAWARSHGDRSA